MTTATAPRDLSLWTLAERAKKNKDTSILRRVDGFHVDPRIIREQDGLNPRNYASDATREHIERLTAAYLAGEFVEPITVRINGEHIEVVEGHCRRIAAINAMEAGAELTHLRINPFVGDDLDVFLHVSTSNDKLPLAPCERAHQYRNIMTRFGLTQSQVAKRVGKSQGHVSQALKLLELPERVQDMIDRRILSPSEALAQAADYLNQTKQAMTHLASPDEIQATAYTTMADNLERSLSQASSQPSVATQPETSAPTTGTSDDSSVQPIPRLTATTLNGKARVTQAQLRKVYQEMEALAQPIKEAKVTATCSHATLTIPMEAYERLMELASLVMPEAKEETTDKDQLPLVV